MSPWRIALGTQELTPASAEDLVSGIKKVAPQSTLISIPAIAASYAALVAKGTALGLAVTAVAEDETLLKTDTKKRDTAYSALLLELVGLKALVLSNATSAADITGMGFTLLGSTTASRTKPDAPSALIVQLGKVHGKARVTVQTTGENGRFVAESSPDPIGTWTSLPGNGKQRKLSGFASGAKLWVHFAQVRYGLQSDWSAPVLVCFP
jgi:hypothetical protein